MNIFEQHTVHPLSFLGLTGKFWAINYQILMATWIAMGFMFFLVWLGRRCLDKEPTVISTAYETAISMFMGMFRDTFGYFNYDMFAFLIVLFIFTLTNCMVGILPFVEEATKDLNTTLALGVSSFLCIQGYKIKVHGLKGYLKEFMEPFFVMLPMHIFGELAKVISMSFRLFGNILGGSVIWAMLIKFIGNFKVPFFVLFVTAFVIVILTNFTTLCNRYRWFIVTGKILMTMLTIIAWGQIFLGIFEGIIQSFVITMLSMTYLAIGTQVDDAHRAHDSKGHA